MEIGLIRIARSAPSSSEGVDARMHRRPGLIGDRFNSNRPQRPVELGRCRSPMPHVPDSRYAHLCEATNVARIPHGGAKCGDKAPAGSMRVCASSSFVGKHGEPTPK